MVGSFLNHCVFYVTDLLECLKNYINISLEIETIDYTLK